jgi:alkyl sulfatase BDS1-like metallo-beta-lactamase superfamily hydrolase
MADLLGLSSRIIDSGVLDEPSNRVTQELSEVADGIAVIESFSHVVSFRTAEGLVLFDTSGVWTGAQVVEALRHWSQDPVHSAVYTHGHMDHVGGSQFFATDALARGDAPPRVVGHENVLPRFARYDLTNGYNLAINARQFGGTRQLGLDIGGGSSRFHPEATLDPDVVVGQRLDLRVGEVDFELRHSKGETDDHLWAWIPQHRAICAGDFFIWNFPNAGNPQKVQRYPLEWAQALRDMAACDAELFLPAHGLPIAGKDRIRGVLDDVAGALESLVFQTLERMNAGESLDVVVHAVKVKPDVLAKPYLRPFYDEPEFVVRNVWRLYGGWYDGNPAHLKPAPETALARELAGLAGGAAVLATRALELADAGELRLACHLAELAVQAEPNSREAHGARADVYAAHRRQATSLMAKGIYGAAARESRFCLEASDD